MRIIVTLHRDRRRAGSFELRNDAGELLLAGPALGRAAQEIATRDRNPTRDPLKPSGDTPTGTYIGRWHKLPAYMEGFGPALIRLDPTAGDALRAKQNGRHGLAIHGGRGSARLVPTGGCVRLLDSDFERLAVALAIANIKSLPVTVQEQ